MAHNSLRLMLTFGALFGLFPIYFQLTSEHAIAILNAEEVAGTLNYANTIESQAVEIARLTSNISQRPFVEAKVAGAIVTFCSSFLLILSLLFRWHHAMPGTERFVDGAYSRIVVALVSTGVYGAWPFAVGLQQEGGIPYSAATDLAQALSAQVDQSNRVRLISDTWQHFPAQLKPLVFQTGTIVFATCIFCAGYLRQSPEGQFVRRIIAATVVLFVPTAATVVYSKFVADNGAATAIKLRDTICTFELLLCVLSIMSVLSVSNPERHELVFRSPRARISSVVSLAVIMMFCALSTIGI